MHQKLNTTSAKLSLCYRLRIPNSHSWCCLLCSTVCWSYASSQSRVAHKFNYSRYTESHQQQADQQASWLQHNTDACYANVTGSHLSSRPYLDQTTLCKDNLHTVLVMHPGILLPGPCSQPGKNNSDTVLACSSCTDHCCQGADATEHTASAGLYDLHACYAAATWQTRSIRSGSV